MYYVFVALNAQSQIELDYFFCQIIKSDGQLAIVKATHSFDTLTPPEYTSGLKLQLLGQFHNYATRDEWETYCDSHLSTILPVSKIEWNTPIIFVPNKYPFKIKVSTHVIPPNNIDYDGDETGDNNLDNSIESEISHTIKYSISNQSGPSIIGVEMLD